MFVVKHVDFYYFLYILTETKAMLLILSPAKKLDYSEDTRYISTYTQPQFLDESQKLIDILVEKQPDELMSLMDISSQLAELNYERYQNFSRPFSPENAKQALLTFKGDVYTSFQLDTYTEAEYEYAQKHVRILSGLYGLLRPLDLMQPYRLEMGTKLSNERGKNLYDFWKEEITQHLNEAIKESGSKVLINLASNEYARAIDKKKLKGTILDISFKDERNGQYKPIFLYVKQARGAMCDYAIREKVVDPEGLKGFTDMGYHYNESLSSDNEWVFTR